MWVTVEGVNGVGKTYLARAAAQRLGGGCQLIAELTDLPGSSLPGQVVEALRAGGGTFLRGGCPAAETLALLALKTRVHESWQAMTSAPGMVLEDFSRDCVNMWPLMEFDDFALGHGARHAAR